MSQVLSARPPARLPARTDRQRGSGGASSPVQQAAGRQQQAEERRAEQLPPSGRWRWGCCCLRPELRARLPLEPTTADGFKKRGTTTCTPRSPDCLTRETIFLCLCFYYMVLFIQGRRTDSPDLLSGIRTDTLGGRGEGGKSGQKCRIRR